MGVMRNQYCIDWNVITLDLLTGAIQGMVGFTNLYSLSRPCRSGEKIDFFISNSWYDDPHLKFQKLTELAQNFHEKHGRFPTFWLDKCCIDQGNIRDGLMELPVNVMACGTMLMMAGPTYAT